MDRWAPEFLAEDWDNVGFQLGREDLEVTGVVLALDLDERVYKFAVENKCNMIISHHPFIFTGLKSITNRSYDGRLIMDIIKNDMVFYAAHTNLDQAIGGVNDKLARVFELEDSRVLEVTGDDEEIGYGRIGKIKDQKLGDFIGKVKEKLGVDHLTVYGDIGKKISSLAIVGGSGSSFISQAKREGADLLITGDIKYHDGQLAEKLGLALIDGGHFHTEKLILEDIGIRLEKLNKNLKIKTYKYPSPLYKIY